LRYFLPVKVKNPTTSRRITKAEKPVRSPADKPPVSTPMGRKKDRRAEIQLE